MAVSECTTRLVTLYSDGATGQIRASSITIKPLLLISATKVKRTWARRAETICRAGAVLALAAARTVLATRRHVYDSR